MQAPTVADLLKELAVQQALEQAWLQSLPDDLLHRHEEGGWIYMDTISRDIAVRHAPAGAQATLDLNTPPLVPGAVVVATFHTPPQSNCRRVVFGTERRGYSIGLGLWCAVPHSR